MASNHFILRCKTEKGPVTLTELTYDSTIEELKSNVAKLTQLKPENMKFLNGYPPKPLIIENDNLKLCELDIKSGDTLIVECQKMSEEIKSPLSFVRERSLHEIVFDQSGIMMRHVVPSNNSCLFTSVYFILSHGVMDFEKSNSLRGIISEVVANNRVKYTTAFLGKPNEEYCEWIKNPAHWGGAIELSILCEHFQLEIVAIDTMSLIAHRFGENNHFEDRIFLIYDGIHYDPLVLELGNTVQTVFPASDPRPMEMALEIAREAKSSRQFTDITNFTLFCKICQERFVGERQVAEHARVTGHCEFGEF
ncbi:ubiquitin thioesterase OTU1-like [Argiope bruennichi]|uniref:ubiquitin thioesterase OTU1-like n=1 Tax=Argiope bruennichi TaxID=94029 RepID=UPI002493FFB2|nr:ubiquitin thioesterase OTU1-like [Argiope bruennichi]